MLPVEPLIVVAVLLFLSVLAGKVSGRFGIPALLLFLAIGMAAGSDGPGGIEFTNAELAASLGAIALAFILFSGGLDTRWDAVRPVLVPGVLLATVGTFVTALVTGLAAGPILGVSVTLGLLVGAIVSSTDAAAVFSVLRSRGVGLRGRLRPLLELESASNDPMAVFLTVGLTTLLTSPSVGPTDLLWLFVRQWAIGGVLGVVLALGAVHLVNRIRLEYEGLYPVLTIALVLSVYAITDTLGGSGFLAVYLSGVTMARHRLVHKRSLIRFHDGISWLMQIGMFLVLGLLVFPSQLLTVALPGLLLALVLVLVARPAAVFLCLVNSSWEVRDRALVSWVGLRGAVPIILATFPLAAGVQGAGVIFNAVFFVVLISIALQGTTIPVVARFLGVAATHERAPSNREEVVAGSAAGRTLEEILVPDGAWVVGRMVVELDLPPGSWLAMVRRGTDVLVPQGPTVIEAGDVVTVLANPWERRAVETLLASGRSERPDDPALDADPASTP